MSNMWGGEGACKAVKYIGDDPGGFHLSCHLDDNHPELHWDRGYEVVWGDWTEADEAAEAER